MRRLGAESSGGTLGCAGRLYIDSYYHTAGHECPGRKAGGTDTRQVEIPYATQDDELAEGVVLLCFGSQKSLPWKALERELAQLPSSLGKVLQSDVEVDTELAERYKVRVMPHLVLLRDGKVLEHIVGAVSRVELESSMKRAGRKIK